MQNQNDEQPKTGGYRIKFNRDEFLRVLSVANPKRLYAVRDVIYFSFDGFVMYCDQLSDEDLMRYDVIQAIEFSNVPWKKV